ncbi:MAG: Gfo/Idh/MocA family oxidoreductase [Clostridia bacterium]|nr:Gfo/Idh/MocA family oxidoreductase [Clostridia bacterium]
MKENLIIIGFGGSGKRYAENLSKYFKEFNLNILPTSKNSNIKTHFNIVKDIDEAIKLKPVGVFIATPTSMHLKYAEKFKDIASFIVIDKPLDSDLYKCEVFERNFRFSKTKVYINYQRRYIECWENLKIQIDNCIKNNNEFRYGIIHINSFMPNWRKEKNYKELYAARKTLGGGALLTECHEIDLIQWIFGKIKEVNSCVINTNSFKLDVEDAFHVNLMVETNNALKPITVVTDFMNEKVERKAEFVFDNISLIINEDENELLVIPENKVLKGNKEKDKIAHERFIQELYEKVVMDKDKKIPDIYDGLSVNAVIESIKKAYSLGKKVEVNNSIFPIEGAEYLDILTNRVNEEFKEKLVAIYGMGSLGYGGYVEGWSDFDIDVIIENVSYDEAKEYFKIGKEIEKEIVNLGFERIDIRVYSIEHLNERKTILTYGQCSRASMLCDSAKLIYGKEIKHKVNKPSVQEMNKEAIGLLDIMNSRTDKEWDNTPWDDIAAFYALNARFLYSKDTGKVAGKKLALEYFIDNYSKYYSEDVLSWTIWALACRNYYDYRYIQDRLHSKAIKNLKESFIKTKEILVKEGEQ